MTKPAYRIRLSLELLESRAVPTTVQGAVFNDLNGNGLRDIGEPGLAGWTVFIDVNKNNLIDAGDLTATTDANGAYSIDTSALPPPGYYAGLDLQVGSGG